MNEWPAKAFDRWLTTPPDDYPYEEDCEDCGDPAEMTKYGALCVVCYDETLRDIAQDRAFEEARERSFDRSFP